MVKKTFKLLLKGCLLLVALFVVLLAAAIIFTMNYHTQIANGFLSIVNYVFGNSPENVLRGFIQQLTDNYLSSLFSGN
jgi:hypothetical protein